MGERHLICVGFVMVTIQLVMLWQCTLAGDEKIVPRLPNCCSKALLLGKNFVFFVFLLQLLLELAW